jgi:large repetitive protein
MNTKKSSRFRKFLSVSLGVMLMGSFMTAAYAENATTATASTTPSSASVSSGFIEFNNLKVQAVSGTGPSADIAAANTASSQCIFFGSSAVDQGQTISCPTVAPFRVQVEPATRLFFRGKSTATIGAFAAGDMINAFGFFDAGTGIVQAILVRDLSKTKKSAIAPSTAPSDPPGDPVADLTVTKVIDNAAPQAGGTVNYLLTASALGPATSTGVVVSDALPSGASFVSATPSVGNYETSTGNWTIGAMPSGTTATLALRAIVDASDTARQTVVNTATVHEDALLTNNDASHSSSSAAFTVAGATTTPSSTVAGLIIATSIDNTAPQAGTTVHYTLTASALGPATSTGVTATDLLPSGLTFVSANPSVGTYSSSTGTWTIGDLMPSATATLQIAAMVNASDTPGQAITDMATIGENASLANPNATQASSQVTITVAQAPLATSTADLAVAKTVDNAAPQTGMTIHYSIAATDLGPATSTDAVVNDLLPAGLNFVSATSSAGTYSSSTGIWTIGNLSPNATATLRIAATVNASDTSGQVITNTTTASESNTLIDPNSANNTASANITIATTTPIIATSTAGLELAKVIDNAAPQAGVTVNYTLTASAMGPATSTGVIVNDLLPSGLTFLAATSSMGTYNNANGTWTIGTLSPNATATLRIAATVNASDTSGQVITNTAAATEDPALVNPDSAQATASRALMVATATAVNATSTAGLEIMKVVDNAAPHAGTIVHYLVTASAMGPATSTDVAVHDLLPAGLTFVSATPSVGTYNSVTGMWTIGELTPNATATLNIAAMVNASDPAGQIITNSAAATEDASLVNPESAQATASVALAVTPAPVTVPIVPATLSIGANGNFLSRGMIVTSVGSSSFQAQVWGNTYTVNFVGNGDNDGDEFLFRNGNTPFNFEGNGGQFSDQVIVGDIVNVSGRVTTAAPFVVAANVVRNDSIVSPRESQRNFGFGGDNGGSFNSGSSSDNGSDNGNSSSGSSSSSGNNASIQAQLNSLTAQLLQLEQMFQRQFNPTP